MTKSIVEFVEKFDTNVKLKEISFVLSDFSSLFEIDLDLENRNLLFLVDLSSFVVINGFHNEISQTIFFIANSNCSSEIHQTYHFVSLFFSAILLIIINAEVSIFTVYLLLLN